jgi:hypothetical protein
MKPLTEIKKGILKKYWGNSLNLTSLNNTIISFEERDYYPTKEITKMFKDNYKDTGVMFEKAIDEALLEQAQEFEKMILDKMPKFCPYCALKYGTCECKKDDILDYLEYKLKELLKEVQGDEK